MDQPRRALRVGVILLLAALGLAMFRQGGYHQAQHQLFAILCAIAGLDLLLSTDRRRSLRWAGLAVAPMLAASILSVAVATERGDAPSTFLTIGLVGIALATAHAIPAEQRQLAVDGALLVASIVALSAIWGVSNHTSPWGRITEGIWRGSSSLTYSNAAAAVVGPCAVLTFWLAARLDRWIYAAVTTLMLIGFAATQSRGGALALMLVVGITAVRMDTDRFIRAAIPVGLGAAIGGVPVLAFAPDATTPNPPIALAAVAVGIALTAGLFGQRNRVPRPGLLLTALVAAGLVGIMLTPVGDTITERLSLRSGTTAGGEEAEVLFGDRGREWSTAWERFTDAPITGNGPGNVDLRWTENGRNFRAIFVHNEYLELAVTHGIVGLAALLAGAYLVMQQRPSNALGSPVGLAISAFMAHSTVDFLWHIPALPVFFAFLAGLSLIDKQTAPMV